MSHFAYPNVLPKKGTFIGCGRYKVLPKDNQFAGDYKEIVETPNTPNKSQVEYALQLLSPSSYDADGKVVEKQDHPQYRYQGNSLDLAYFLAHSHLSRRLNTNIAGDIWCSGVIKVKDGEPLLKKVDDTGFHLKLSHFLNKKNMDNLFIVPAANIQKGTLETISRHSAEIRSLRQLGKKLTLPTTGKKLILKVLPNELSLLLNLLFLPYRTIKNGKKWPFFVACVLAACVIGFWLIKQADRPDFGEIEKLLNEGNLVAAKQMVQQTGKNSPLVNDLWTLMTKPIKIEMTLLITKRGGKDSKKIVLKENGRLALMLSHEDDYRLGLSTSNPVDDLYLYIFQIDESNHAYTIFPNVKWKLDNPIHPTQWPLFIPKAQDEWLFLDQLTAAWENGMTETLHILVSPWRANDIEATISEIQAETDRNSRKQLIAVLKQQLMIRQKTDLPSITYRHSSFHHN